MKNNIIKFGDTYWAQIKGTAMGVSFAPSYANIYYAQHEATHLTRQHHPRLINAYRLIDDRLTLWNVDPAISPSPSDDLDHLKNDMEVDSIRWTHKNLSRTVDFLDVTLTIDTDNRIQYCLYEKQRNRHLYIPSISAHPKSTLKGLIYGQLSRFHHLNSDKTVRNKNIKQFYTHLRRRGYSHQKIAPLINQAFRHVVTNTKRKPKGPPRTGSIKPVVHIRYHPSNLPTAIFHHEYSRTIKNLHRWPGNKQRISLDDPIMCNHRPKNLNDLLIRANLLEHPDNTVDDAIFRLAPAFSDALLAASQSQSSQSTQPTQQQQQSQSTTTSTITSEPTQQPTHPTPRRRRFRVPTIRHSTQKNDNNEKNENSDFTSPPTGPAVNPSAPP